MATTNPSQTTYEDYALERLTVYLKEDVCNKEPKIFADLLHRNCTLLVDVSQSKIKQLISDHTEQQNLLFFSIYRTDLAIEPFTPSYHFETVGVFGHLYTYAAEKL